MGVDGGGGSCDNSYSLGSHFSGYANYSGLLEDLQYARVNNLDVQLLLDKASFVKQSGSPPTIPNFNTADIYEMDFQGRKYKASVCMRAGSDPGHTINCGNYDDPIITDQY